MAIVDAGGAVVSVANKILDRLDAVRQSGPGKWRARCPAHDGKSLSLAIADADGRVLIKCFAGCDTEAVLGALGLTFGDLYDRPSGNFAPVQRKPWSARDVLDLVQAEAMLVAIVASNFLESKTIAEPDWDRLAQAANRLTGIANEVQS